METLKAFAMGLANQHKELMIFDWHKAVKLIKKHNAKYAFAGLRGDWEWTGGIILRNGKIASKEYIYLASTWAKPEIEIDGKRLVCYKMKSKLPKGESWDAHTFWPESARKLFLL